MLLKYLAASQYGQSAFYIASRTFAKIQNLSKLYPELHVCPSLEELAPAVDLVFVCVKPLDIKPVLSVIRGLLKPSCHIVSLNASVMFEHLERIAPDFPISKAIPSITAEVNQSVTLVCHNQKVLAKDKKNVYSLLECFGSVTEVPETELSLGATITSSMPGFIGAMFRVIADEAVKHTILSRDTILKMLLETYYGTGTLLLAKAMPFSDLVERVATKGGATEEGTALINAQFPGIIQELFIKTLTKRQIIIDQAIQEFQA